MPYTIPSSVISPGAVYQPRKSKLILDQITGAIAAWSTRRLISSAPANIARGRDASTTEVDFTAAELAGAGFTGLAGAGDGFYVTLYDQIGNKNATQSTAASQPKGVSSGSLITNGSIPVLQTDGADDVLTNASFVPNAFNSGSIFARFKTSTRTSAPMVMGMGRDGTDIRVQLSQFTGKAVLFCRNAFATVCNINSNAAIDDNSWHSVVGAWEIDSFKMYIDGVQQTETDTSGTCSLTVGDALSFAGHIGFQKFTGQLNDLIIFNRAITSSEASTLHTALA